MSIRPTFQAQNPAISGYSLGWISCTAFAAAMAGSFDQQVPKLCTGGQVRTLTHDTTGGLTLAQVDAALLAGWNVNLNTTYSLPWADFAKKINAGCAGILQGGYGPIADSRYDAGRGFRGNHAVLVLPGWIVMDPLADGRAAGVYKYHGEAYPQSLLKAFAGKLNLGNRLLGFGLTYASFTRDNVHTYRVQFAGGAFWVYTIGPDGNISGRSAKRISSASSAPCTGPRAYSWPGHANRTLVRVTAGSFEHDFIAVPQANVHLKVVP